jgi:hypothetical protein
MNESRPIEAPADERSVARKYGVRELIFPDSDQIRALCQYLNTTIESGRSGPPPKTAVLVMLEFLQGTLNRQFITKSPTMSRQDYELLSSPYYLSARIISKIAREKQDAAEQKGKLYQTTFLTLQQLINLLRSMRDPGCPWLRKDARAVTRLHNPI